MRFKTILTFTGAEHSDADVRQAISISQDLEAHLDVVAFAVAAPPPVGQYGALLSEVWMEEREQQEALLAERVARLSELLKQQEMSFHLAGEYAERLGVSQAAARYARFADLTLVGREIISSDVLCAPLLQGVLFEAERPVLLLPDHEASALRPEKILVAWNASHEALRAVRESLGLLVAAREVHITMIDPEADEQESEPGVDVATWLARQGARVSVDRIPGMGRPDGEVLLGHAADIGADLIVMGAYEHSRLRQRIFGGVTRTMIERAPLPVFMAR